MIRTLVLSLLAGGIVLPLSAAEAESGPVVENYGAVYRVADPVEVAAASAGLRAVFDVSVGSADPAQLNSRIDTVARYLNMHVAAGFPSDQVRAALVLHGTAARDSLSHSGYRQRFGVDNPNLDLLSRLRQAGVEIYLCGQSAEHRGFERAEIAEPVNVALSAMTVLLQKQAVGYGLIAF